MKIKTGIGFDAHKFSPDRDLILGGVKIDYDYGLLGHSDADVLIHAIIDSLAGVTLSSDIGKLFPDNDNKYKNIDSRILLKNIAKMILDNNFEISNIDSVIIAQQPKLSPYINQMVQNISSDLNINLSDISIKATTTEYMGFTGRKEGIAAVAVATVIKK
jgi:2-C-methyl-D-erythritol 2,4-cyclodiphosphate synthase